MNEQTVMGIFAVSGIQVLNKWKIENQYWPDAYKELKEKSPWWLIKTTKGLIEIGWRKRVISIDWSDTGIRKVVTDEDVTKSETMVHARSEEDAICYLKALGITQPC